MELVLVKIDSIEWNVMWDWLGSHPINQGIENPSLALHEGEGWQYTGSFKQGDRVISSFRHRNHPLTKTIQTLSFSHPYFNPTSIDKEYRL